MMCLNISFLMYILFDRIDMHIISEEDYDVSEKDFNTMVDTIYLFNNSKNADRLFKAMKEIDNRIDEIESY